MAELDIDNSDETVQKVKKFMPETCGYARNLTLPSLPIFKPSRKTKKSATKGIEVLDAASFIKEAQSQSYIFTELAIPDFEDSKNITRNTGFFQELMETPNECLLTQLLKNRSRPFMRLLTIMSKKMQSCILAGSRDLEMKRLDSCLRRRQRWTFGESMKEPLMF